MNILRQEPSGAELLRCQAAAAPDTGWALTWHNPWDVGDNDGLPEDGSVKDVPDGTVGGLPHLLQLEL